MLKLVSFHIQAHLNVFLQILEYFSQSVDVDGLNLLAYSVFELFNCARGPIKNYVIEIMTCKIIQYTHTGNDGKQPGPPHDLDLSNDLHLPVFCILTSRRMPRE